MVLLDLFGRVITFFFQCYSDVFTFILIPGRIIHSELRKAHINGITVHGVGCRD